MDFEAAESWNRTHSGSRKISPPLITPIACCKQLPTKDNLDLSCAQEPFKEALNNGNTVSLAVCFAGFTWIACLEICSC